MSMSESVNMGVIVNASKYLTQTEWADKIGSRFNFRNSDNKSGNSFARHPACTAFLEYEMRASAP